jgi:hypothetical protein
MSPAANQTLHPDLHDTDFYTWAMETARALRAGRFEELDWNAIAEELEDMGRSEKRELVNRLVVLLAHLLKWEFQPERQSRSWRLTVKEQRLAINEHLTECPGLKPLVNEMLRTAYRRAVIQAARETGLEESDFPAHSPWTFGQALDGTFWP